MRGHRARAVLEPTITWADLIATARTDPRIAIAAANPDLDAAIVRALAILTRLGAAGDSRSTGDDT